MPYLIKNVLIIKYKKKTINSNSFKNAEKMLLFLNIFFFNVILKKYILPQPNSVMITIAKCFTSINYFSHKATCISENPIKKFDVSADR